MSDFKFWWEREGVDFAKVTYRAKDGYVTQAYIDANTGNGENKHTGEPVHVEWSDEEDIWLRTDDIEWTMDERTGVWIPKMPPGWTPPEKEPFVRTQPKLLTRRQRHSGKVNERNAR